MHKNVLLVPQFATKDGYMHPSHIIFHQNEMQFDVLKWKWGELKKN